MAERYFGKTPHASGGVSAGRFILQVDIESVSSRAVTGVLTGYCKFIGRSSALFPTA
jgi:hypothetical protein